MTTSNGLKVEVDKIHRTEVHMKTSVLIKGLAMEATRNKPKPPANRFLFSWRWVTFDILVEGLLKAILDKTPGKQWNNPKKFLSQEPHFESIARKSLN